ncbi:OB-fold nucleic acid binding domain-containing protein [Candidatus Woesearchaeota archaeon]|nr:OB-fold nucleic acid binding domain-containing protein [Candidatus Woesearchaeota archaeon]
MNETSLLRTALVTGIIGLVALYIISRHSTIPETHTYEITNSHAGKDVRIRGTLQSIRETDKLLILQVSEEKQVTVIQFKGKSKQNLSAGDKILVTGTAETYKGNPQIIAEEIKQESQQKKDDK